MASSHNQKGQSRSTDEKTSVVDLSAFEGPKKPEKQSFASVLAEKQFTKSKSIEDAVAKIRAAVTSKQSFFEPKVETKTPPFYINSSTSTASLVKNEQGVLLEDDPYNIVVAAVIAETPFRTALFEKKVDSIFKDAPSKETLTLVSSYAHKIRAGQLEMNEIQAEKRDLLKAINRYVANRAWKFFSGYENMLYPPDAKAKIDDYLKDLKGAKRKKGSKHIDVTYRRQLLRELEKLVTADNIDYAHAIVHGITVVADFSCKNIPDVWQELLSKHKSLRPSWNDIEQNGILPNVELRKFKNLFTPIEWGVISKKGAFKFEDDLKKLRQSELTFEGIKKIVLEAKSLRKALDEDPFIEHYLAIKKQRLLECAKLKSDLPKGKKLNMWKEIGRSWTDNPKLQEAFGIGRIPLISDEIVGYTYQSLNSQVSWNDDTKSYEIGNPDSVPEASALALVSEFINLIS
jgi:hypothetical protein